MIFEEGVAQEYETSLVCIRSLVRILCCILFFLIIKPEYRSVRRLKTYLPNSFRFYKFYSTVSEFGRSKSPIRLPYFGVAENSNLNTPRFRLTTHAMSLTDDSNVTIRRVRNGSRLTRFCWTLNNPTEAEISFHTEPETWSKHPRYTMFGREVGANGTPHLQGFTVLGTQTAFSTVKKWPGFIRTHIEPCRGSVTDNIKYCSKEDQEPFTWGEAPADKGGGKCKELVEATKAVEEGLSLHAMATSNDHGVAIVKFHRGLTVYRSLREAPRRSCQPPAVFWFYGPTGSGKTSTAYRCAAGNSGGSDEEPGSDNLWISSGSLQWFDGYDGQRMAVFDDFRTDHCKFPFLLRLTDRYPLRVPFKGGFVNWAPEIIVITAPHDIRTTFATRDTHRPEDIHQLFRRLEQGGGGMFQFPEEAEDAAKLLLSAEARAVRIQLAKDRLSGSTEVVSNETSTGAPERFTPPATPPKGVAKPKSTLPVDSPVRLRRRPALRRLGPGSPKRTGLYGQLLHQGGGGNPDQTGGGSKSSPRGGGLRIGGSTSNSEDELYRSV